MVVRNRSTKKDHTLLRKNWDNMPDKHKALFDIIDPNDEEKEIKVVGDLIPNDNKKHKHKKQ